MGISSQPEGQLIRVELRLTVGEQTVPALFFVPREEGDPMPLVLIQHPATGSKDDYFVADIARMWASRGWICGGFDAPFHGDRVPNDPMSIFRDRDSYPQLIDQIRRKAVTNNFVYAFRHRGASCAGFLGRGDIECRYEAYKDWSKESELP